MGRVDSHSGWIGFWGAGQRGGVEPEAEIDWVGVDHIRLPGPPHLLVNSVTGAVRFLSILEGSGFRRNRQIVNCRSTQQHVSLWISIDIAFERAAEMKRM